LSGSPQHGIGMTPPGPNIMQGVSEADILTQALAQNPGDRAAAYRQAAKQIMLRGRALNDPNATFTAGRMLDEAEKVELAQKKTQADISKSQADTSLAQAETSKNKQEMTAPKVIATDARLPNGDRGVMVAYPDGKGGYSKPQVIAAGPDIATVSPESPTDLSTNEKDFAGTVTGAVNTIRNISAIKAGLVNPEGSAKIGWAEDAASALDKVVGTAGQLMGTLDSDSLKALNDVKKQGWYQKT